MSVVNHQKLDTQTAESTTAAVSRRHLDRSYRRRRSALDILIVFGVLLTISIVASLLRPDTFPFLSAPNVITGLEAIPLLTIAAIGVGVLMIAGEFDVSVGSNFVFSSMVMAMIVDSGGPPFMAMAVAIICGCLIGLVNGILTLWLKIPSFIATLGTMGIWAAATLFVHGASAQPFPTEGIFAAITSGRVGGWIPASMIWLTIIGIITALFLQQHKFGNHLYAAGGDPQSATASGVAVRRTKLIAFIFAGAMAAMAGVLSAARVNTVSPGGSIDLPLIAIAVAVIGGVSLTGGRGTVVGIIVGGALIYWIQNVLLLVGAPGFYLAGFVGALIIVAATFYRVTNHRRLK